MEVNLYLRPFVLSTANNANNRYNSYLTTWLNSRLGSLATHCAEWVKLQPNTQWVIFSFHLTSRCIGTLKLMFASCISELAYWSSLTQFSMIKHSFDTLKFISSEIKRGWEWRRRQLFEELLKILARDNKSKSVAKHSSHTESLWSIHNII